MTQTKLHPDAIAALVYADHGAPHEILGSHADSLNGTVTIRTLKPNAISVNLIDTTSPQMTKMHMLHEMGLFEVTIKADIDTLDYHFEAQTRDGSTETYHDPYKFAPLFTDYDLYLFAEGRHWDIYNKMGAHLREVNGVKGVNFALWAPNAQRVSVIGNFNFWDARYHPMSRNGKNGIWEIFIPGIGVDEHYKFDIKSQHMGYREQKIDPYAFYAERRPSTASIVADLTTYEWQDEAWMADRRERDALTSPMSIYEVHLGSWKRHGENDGEWLTYRELADELVGYIKEMGYTHIELMPVAEHPLDASWGYQVTGYYAPTSRFGTPEDFMYFIDQCHQNNIGVILDWVPAHFPKDGHALSYFDGTHLYSHADPRKGEHPDWGTYIFNYGRNEVRNFLIANALFWIKEYHIDGLRVDAVSSMVYLDFSREDGQWIPNQYGGNENLDAVSFLQEANTIIHSQAPGAVTIAEESTAWPLVSRPTYVGGLGFTLKWNMGWMHDTLNYAAKDPVYRKWEHNKLTFSMMYAFTENFVLSLSHDEVVHGKGSLMGKLPGDWWQKFAGLRLLFGYQYTHPGKKLNFMTADIAQWTEWSEARSIDWQLMELQTHQSVNRWVKDLNHFYRSEPALYEVDFAPEGFEWIQADDYENSVFSYIRYSKDKKDMVVVVMNFTPIPREEYRVGVPRAGYYKEMLNSDADIYGGGNVGNGGGAQTEAVKWHNKDYSLRLTVPPLGIVVLKKES